MANGQELVVTALGIMTRDALEEQGLEFRPVMASCPMCHKKHEIELLFNKVEGMNDPLDPNEEWDSTCDACFDDLCN